LIYCTILLPRCQRTWILFFMLSKFKQQKSPEGF